MPTPPPARFRFGSYWLLRRLAKGGMAEIYLASPTEAGREDERLVIKRLLPQLSQEEEFLVMFLQEARLASQLAHPNIVRILDLGLQGGHLYLAMEYIDGVDLESLVRVRHQWLTPPMAARIGIEICAALSYAHQATDLTGMPLRIVHRDVTPENVMISRQGEIKLVDFGVAKATARLTLTRPGVVKGKLCYLAPEHIQGGELDGRADLFALGTTLYTLTTGVKPFDREQPTDTVAAVLRDTPPTPTDLIPSYPQELSRIIVKAMEKDRNRRYANAKEFKAELERFLDSTQQVIGTGDLAALVAEAMRAEAKPAEPMTAKLCPPPLPKAPKTLLEAPSVDDIEVVEDEDPATIPVSVVHPGRRSQTEEEPRTDVGLPMGETLAQAIASSLAPSFPPAPAAKPAVEYLGDSNQNTVTVPHQEQQPSSRKGTLAMGVVFVAAMVAALLIGRWTAERDIDARMAAFAATLLKDAAAAGPDASSRDASSLEDAGMNAGSAGLDAATSRPDAGGRADAATPARREPVRANLSRPQPQPQEPPTPVEPPEGFGIVAFEGRGTATIEDKSCRAPCSLQVPIGEHSVKMAGRRKVEKKIFVGSGGQTLRMP